MSARIVDDNGEHLWADIACTIPEYRGPLPEIGGPSECALELRRAEYEHAADELAALFNITPPLGIAERVTLFLALFCNGLLTAMAIFITGEPTP